MTLSAEALRGRRYRAAHPERKRASNEIYYETSRHVCLESSRKFRARNRPWVNMQARERRKGLKATPIAELRRLYPNG